MWIFVNWVLHGRFLFHIILKIIHFRFIFFLDAEWRINLLLLSLGKDSFVVIGFEVTRVNLHILSRNLKCSHFFFGVENSVFTLKLIENGSNLIQKIAKYFFITKPSLLFLADRWLLISPTRVNFYVAGRFRDVFTGTEEHPRSPCTAVLYSKVRC